MPKKIIDFKKVPFKVPLKKYTIKIFDAGGDITKDWYVRWFFRNSVTGKLERQNNVKLGCNRIKDKKERYKFLSDVVKLMEYHLNNIEDLKNLDFTSEKKILSYDYCCEHFLQIKKNVISEISIRDYKSIFKIFKEYLKQENIDLQDINNIKRKNIIEFLNYRLKITSARTRNNNKINLSSFFEFLKNQEIIEKNITEGIDRVKSNAKKHKIYTPEQFKIILNEIEKIDAQMSLYIKFVAYLFVRPVECCRIKIADIDLKNRTISYQAKNKPLKRKYIIDLIYNELLKINLDKYPKEANLFSPENIPAIWSGKDESKRGYFTNKFNEIIKSNDTIKKIEITKEHDIYSFRHTGIITLYRKYREKLSPYEVKSSLMLITGHTTMSALEKYLRDIDAELPSDYSNDFK